jgi:diguanylate cyclase (GGDEF)-like protein
MVQELDAIPTPTTTAARMLELGMDRGSTKQQYIEVLSADPALTLQLLRNANSPDRKDVPGIEVGGAIEALDGEFLRCLAFTTCTPEGEGSEQERDESSGMTALRRHAVATASIARELAFVREYFQPEEAFAAGMMSVVGQLALATLKPAAVAELRQRAVGCAPERVAELEADLCGVGRDEMAVAIGEAWDLAIEMRQVLSFQGRSFNELDRDCPRQDQELVTLVRTARRLAAEAGFPTQEGLEESQPAEDVAEALESIDVEAMIEHGKRAVASAAERSRPKHDGDAHRMRNLRVANNELAHLLHRSEHRRQAADSVTKVLRFGLHRLGEGDPLSGLMYLTMESMGFKRIAFIKPDVEEARLIVKASSAMRGNQRVEEGSWIPFPTKNRAFGIPVIASRGDDVPEHLQLLELLGVSACAIAPLIDKEGKCHGYLTADQGPAGGAPVPGDDNCLGIIADQACLLLEYERMTREMERLATVDPLTGAATRRRMMDRLDNLIGLTTRTRQPLSLVMMDLDHFKQFNDTMGHQVGDRLLQDLVKVLDANTRKTDLVARYGGEEFVVVYPGADLDAAYRAADMLRQAVYDFGIEHAEEYNRTPISISMGVAQLHFTEDGTLDEDALALIGRADAALYEAKHNGRNRVERAEHAA